MYSIVVRCLLIVSTTLILMGCGARAHNIPLAADFWEQPKQTIVVASFKAPEPQVYYVGNQGLLDLAVNSAMNKKMNDHLKKTELHWYHNLAVNFSDRLKKNKMNIEMYSHQPEATKKDIEAVVAHAQSNKLLTFQLRVLGARREYYGFIPTGAPQAYCVLAGKLTDLSDKKIWWSHDVEIILPVRGAWDQPPSYPNFTQALHLAMDEAREELVDSFFSGR